MEAANYQQLGRLVEFKEGSTGEIILYCSVTPGEGDVEGSGFSLELYFQDPDGAGNGSSVIARLFKVDLANGENDSGGCSVFSDLDGNPSETGYQAANSACDETFDPNTFLYFAEVAIRRTGDQQVQFHGLSLFGGP